MILTVSDRFALLNLLPQQGDFTTLKMVRELREDLSFSEEENEALKFVATEEGRVTWAVAGEPNKDFDFSPLQNKLICEALDKADKGKKLSLENLSLYERFMAPDLAHIPHSV